MTRPADATLRPGVPVIQRLTALFLESRASVFIVGVLVLVAAAVELVPALVVRDIVDHHLNVGRSDGLASLALLYLLAVAGVQGVTFLYGYAAASAAQSALSNLRTRLFGHLVQLPASFFDRTPIGDVISRCTADVDTLETVFSSGVALLLANLVRLATTAIAMIALSPTLSFVAAVIVAPLVVVTRILQVRIRRAERETLRAIAMVNTRLQEDLRGIEVIRTFAREPEFVAGFRQTLSRGLAASNRSTFYSALYTPLAAILSALAVTILLVAGTQPAVTASLG